MPWLDLHITYVQCLWRIRLIAQPDEADGFNGRISAVNNQKKFSTRRMFTPTLVTKLLATSL